MARSVLLASMIGATEHGRPDQEIRPDSLSVRQYLHQLGGVPPHVYVISPDVFPRPAEYKEPLQHNEVSIGIRKIGSAFGVKHPSADIQLTLIELGVHHKICEKKVVLGEVMWTDFTGMVHIVDFVEVHAQSLYNRRLPTS